MAFKYPHSPDGSRAKYDPEKYTKAGTPRKRKRSSHDKRTVTKDKAEAEKSRQYFARHPERHHKAR